MDYSLKDKKRFCNYEGCEPKKIWVDKGSEICNRSIKSWLQDNDIEIYSTYNEGKENLLLLKNLLEPSWAKFTNICFNIEKKSILIS